MIFVTVGTEKFSFDRLLKTIDENIEGGDIADEVFGQIGSSTYIPRFFEHRKFMPFNQMVDYIKKADIIVTHAGVGSSLLCRSLGKVPILFPRLAEKGEHLDDHQLEFSMQMEKEKKMLVAHDEKELLTAILNYKSLTGELVSFSDDAKTNLVGYLSKVINL